MTNTSQTSQDRPLVTFALFAYNQEKYIREAIEGAFSQTYEPLEIILSDDCSSDRTFEVMQEMAAGYEGPHEVRVRQNRTNVGIIDHVLNVVKLADGELIIVAAGDDISFPQRTTSIAKVWKATGASAVYSGCQDIDDGGVILRHEVFPAPLGRIQALFADCTSPIRYAGLVRNIPGYSAAYSRDLLIDLPYTERMIHNEDALSTYIANLLGKRIGFVEEVLVQRRLSLTSISAGSNFKSYQSVKRNEYIIQSFSRSSIKFFDYFSELDIVKESPDFDKVLARLYAQKEYFQVVSEYWDVSPLDRLKLFFQSSKSSTRKFIFPRLLGMNVFCSFKLLSGKIRGIL